MSMEQACCESAKNKLIHGGEEAILPQQGVGDRRVPSPLAGGTDHFTEGIGETRNESRAPAKNKQEPRSPITIMDLEMTPKPGESKPSDLEEPAYLDQGHQREVGRQASPKADYFPTGESKVHGAEQHADQRSSKNKIPRRSEATERELDGTAEWP